MPALYTIGPILDSTYLDNGGAVVKGFQVSYTITELDESHVINVAKLDDKLIDARIRAEIATRMKLVKLGA